MTNAVEELKKKKYQVDLKRSYTDLLKEAEQKSDEAIIKAKHITLEYYVPLLCERLRVEKFKDIDAATSPIKDIIRMQEEVRATVINDCYWWDPESIRHYWPEWAKDEYRSDLGKAGNEAKRQKLAEKVSAQEAELSQEREKEFNLLSSVMQKVKAPRRVLEQEDKEPTTSYLPTVQEEEPDTPQELYEDACRAIAEIWRTLANKDVLPTRMEDVFADSIKPSRKFRQRLIKGLDDARASHLYDSLIWLNQLVNDILEMMEQIQRETANKPRKIEN